MIALASNITYIFYKLEIMVLKIHYILVYDRNREGRGFGSRGFGDRERDRDRDRDRDPPRDGKFAFIEVNKNSSSW